MASGCPETIDREAQRAELEAVLQSRYFARAPKLAHLLSYLCEKLFAGEAHSIKEYTVGLDVFHRGPSFDQNSDSIVRVEANRLRKRLGEYYANDGASHQLEITIPIGQYVPEFAFATERQNGVQLTQGVSAGASHTRVWSAADKKAGPWFRRPGSGAWWAGAAFAFLLLGTGLVFLLIRQASRTVPLAPTNPLASQPGESQFGLPVGEEVRILAGAGRSFVDHAGKLWSADTLFEGGAAVKNTVAHIWRTQDPAFYRNSRQGQFRYKIPLKKGIYELRLHFAEMEYGPESNGTGGEGSRIMTVRANGKTLLNRFDVVADAGASRTADVKVFPDITPTADENLYLEFSGDDGKQAILSAIEILPGVRGHIRPLRLLARQTPYYSNDSNWWSPDDHFEGGQLAVYTSPVSGTDDPELYETERWGNFSYAIPATPGKYAVTLHFAARHGGQDQQSTSSAEKQAAAARVFDVYCNGKVLLKNFDLPKEAAQVDVVTRKVTGLEPNAQGKLLLNFVPVEGYASVTGIEIIPQ